MVPKCLVEHERLTVCHEQSGRALSIRNKNSCVHVLMKQKPYFNDLQAAATLHLYCWSVCERRGGGGENSYSD